MAVLSAAQIFFILSIIPTLGLSGCLPSDPQRRQVSIVLDASEKGDSAFSPNPVIVPFGGRVVWLNDDVMEHSIVGDAKSGPCAFRSEVIGHGKRFQKSFFQRGVCRYHCGLHGQSMRGKIIVE